MRPEDSFALHVEDTLKAGDELCEVTAVEMLVREAPNCVDRLQNLVLRVTKKKIDVQIIVFVIPLPFVIYFLSLPLEN